MEKKKYPVGAEHYVLYEEIGQGVSASVFRAMCIPNKEIVAIKVLDLEGDNSDLNNISHEAQTMTLVDHPNLLKSHCSFVNDHNLWVVMPFMPGGSCLHILKSAHPEGFEEVVIATILREALKGLEYLHHHGHIHRDVKAGNILICDRGAIKLGDLGVSACLYDSGDRQRMRNTFVGTPCWMAPEVMEQLHGYDFKADIWSFGITALELAHGHAPFSKYPPMKVLLMTLQNAPPGLDYERDKKFSKSFKQMIASCLVKDPGKRPSAEKLLKHSFFKQARSDEFIARKLLEGLPALGDRLLALKRKEEDMLVQKKIPDGQKEEMSQNKYKRGISGWNFDVEDMKAQASLIQDEDPISEKDHLRNSNSFVGSGAGERELQHQLSYKSESSETNDVEGSPPFVDSNTTFSVGKCVKSEDDFGFANSANGHRTLKNFFPEAQNCNKNDFAVEHSFNISGKASDGVVSQSHSRDSGCILAVNGEKLQSQVPVVPSSNGARSIQIVDGVTSESLSKASKTSLTSDEQDEKARCPVVQQKGRFKVTSENADVEKVNSSLALLKSPTSMRVIIQHPNGSQQSHSDPTPMPLNQTSNLLSTVPQTNLERNGKLSCTKQPSTRESTANGNINGGCAAANITGLEKPMPQAANNREKELLDEITDLHRRLLSAQEELHKYRTANAQV